MGRVSDKKNGNKSGESEMKGEQLSKKQIEKGIIILAVFVVLRAIIAKNGGVDQGVQVSSQSILFLTSTFLILSVGLVYLGFSKCDAESALSTFTD